jgi:hypothetical protein
LLEHNVEYLHVLLDGLEELSLLYLKVVLERLLPNVVEYLLLSLFKLFPDPLNLPLNLLLYLVIYLLLEPLCNLFKPLLQLVVTLLKHGPAL